MIVLPSTPYHSRCDDSDVIGALTGCASLQVLNELGGLAEGRGTGATEQRTLDAKGALRWIREMRDGQEQGVSLGRLLKFLVFQKRTEYEQVSYALEQNLAPQN